MSMFGSFFKPRTIEKVVQNTVYVEKELSDEDMTDELLDKWAETNRFLIFREADKITLVKAHATHEFPNGDVW